MFLPTRCGLGVLNEMIMAPKQSRVYLPGAASQYSAHTARISGARKFSVFFCHSASLACHNFGLLCLVEKLKSRGSEFCVFFLLFFLLLFAFLGILIASSLFNFRLLSYPVDKDEESRKTCLYFQRVTQIVIARHVKCFVVVCLFNLLLHYINHLQPCLP